MGTPSHAGATGNCQPTRSPRRLVRDATACRRPPPGLTRRLTLSVLAALLLWDTGWAATPGLEVTANRNRLYLGESLVLNVKVTGADRTTEPDLSQVRRCRIKLLGSQDVSNYSIVIVNGRMQREGFSGRIYAYEVTPEEAGTFLIGPIMLKAGGLSVSADGPEVTVTGISRQDRVGISVEASRTAVLVDEPFDITLRVRIRRLAGRYADTEPLFPANPPVLTVPYLDAQEIQGLKGPDLAQILRSRLAGRNQPGLAINNYTVNNDPFDFANFLGGGDPFAKRAAVFVLDKKAVTENGQPFIEYSVVVSYSPVEEGTYTFGPVVFKGQVPVDVDDRGQASGMEIFAVGPAVTVRVVPPPESGRPDSYVGALGSNLTVQAALDAQTCNVGDPLTLTLTLDGDVQARNLFPPRLSLQTNLVERFEVYDDSVKTIKRERGRQYAYTLRPRQAGTTELPPVEVSYYDVAERGYRTVRTAPIPLKIRQAAEVTASQIIGNVTGPVARASATAAAADLTPAGMRQDPSGAVPATAWGSGPLVLGVLAAGPTVFVCVAGLAAWRRHREQRRRVRRARSALRHALRDWQAAPAAGAAPQARHAHRCATLRRYVADRAGVAAVAMTPAEAAALLSRNGARPESVRAFEALMERHFNGAYGTAESWQDTPADTATACGLLEALDRELPAAERLRPIASNLALWVPWLTMGSLLGAPLQAKAVTADEASFLWNEANTQLAAARAPRDYAAAAEAYQRMIDAGIRNAPLFYNQGTAFLLAGRHDDAIRVLARAERYAGIQADIARNLQIAKARKAGLKTRVMLWDRVLIFWHYRLPAPTRVLLGAIGFCALWVGMALRLLHWRTTARWVVAAGVLLLVLFGSSALTTLVQEQSARRPVFAAANVP